MLPGAPNTLALDPTSDGFAYVVLQGSETLLVWGCSHVDLRKPAAWRAKVTALIEHYTPEFLVLEDMEMSRRGKSARQFAHDVAAFAQAEGLAVQTVTRREVQDAFAAVGRTKHAIAVALARMFPELEPRLPRKRKPWMSEDSRMNIFDALAFALVAIGQLDGLQQ